MTLQIHLPSELEAVIRERAIASGIDIETYVLNVMKDDVAEELATPATRRMSHAEFQARLQRIIERHPVSQHVVDDSRESIYAGRGE